MSSEAVGPPARISGARCRASARWATRCRSPPERLAGRASAWAPVFGYFGSASALARTVASSAVEGHRQCHVVAGGEERDESDVLASGGTASIPDCTGGSIPARLVTATGPLLRTFFKPGHAQRVHSAPRMPSTGITENVIAVSDGKTATVRGNPPAVRSTGMQAIVKLDSVAPAPAPGSGA